MRNILLAIVFVNLALVSSPEDPVSWIRINQLGYRPEGIKGQYGAPNRPLKSTPSNYSTLLQPRSFFKVHP